MRKSFLLTALLVASALGLLLILALNQYRLYVQHEQIIAQTEKLIFQYSIIREQIIADIVDGKLQELADISSSVEQLHSNIIKILDNNLIPAQYKFSFLQQIDFPGLVLLLRKAANEKNDNPLLRRINQETRVIGEHFMLFDRLVMGYAKQKLVDFQAIIIGILAIIVFLVTMLMVITYKMLIMPVINLGTQTKNVLDGQQDKIHKTSSWQEVAALARNINTVLDLSRSEQELAERLQRVLNCCQQVLGKISAATGKEELYHAVCLALLTNNDYFIAWIGVPDTDGNNILPVAAEGSSAMTKEECQQCFGALLAAQEGETDPSNQALQTGETIIITDILAEEPKGPFKNTPLANSAVDSISLPIFLKNEKFGVLTIYTIAQDGVLDSEAELLREMATLLAVRLHYLVFLEKLDIEKAAKTLIGQHYNIITFNLDKNGTILAADSYLSGTLPHNKSQSRNWIDSNINDILIPENDPERIMLNSSLAEGRHYEFNASLAGSDDLYSVILELTNEVSGGDKTFLMILIPPPKDMLIQPENFQVAYTAAIGQFASSMAHEITDLSNGIINYAQMLYDEMHGDENERKEFLNKIIFGGEKLASVVAPLLVDQQDIGFAKYDENIHKIFDDVLLLVGHLFKRDGITVHLDVQPTALTYNKQHLQLILLTLLERLREVLNKRYPHKTPDKSLNISVSQSDDQAKPLLMIEVSLAGRVEYNGDNAQQKRKIVGLWLIQELARNLGGEIKFDFTEEERTKIILILPV